MTTTAANGSQDGAAPPGQSAAWLAPVNVIIAVSTLTALVLRAYLLLRPGVFAVTQYDDGPYFGSAVRLAHGVLPYRGFAFVQPPGVTLLMSPAGLASYLTGTAWGLVIGRFLTVLAGAAAVVLAGLLVRHRGPLTTLLACGMVAIYPPAAGASHTVLLEPWLVLFCLAGAVTVFDGDRLTASTRRLAWGGALFGFAGTMKAWAIVPVLIIAVLCLPALRRAGIFVAGVAAGFIVPVLPFAIAAPRLFYDDVVVAQLARIGPRDPLWHRLGSMIGLPGADSWPRNAVVLAWLALVIVLILLQAAALLVTRQQPPPLEWFATVSAALIVVMFLWPPFFASHYSAFFGPFIALTLALPAGRLAAAARRPAARAPAAVPWAGAPWLARAGLVLLTAAVVAGAVAQAPTASLSRARRGSPAAAGRAIPPGACVVTDQASYLLLANRFTSDVPGCSQMVDGLGTDLALSGGRRPGSGVNHIPAVTAAWRQAFSHAQYVLLSPKNSLRIPWNHALTAYFRQNFRRVQHGYAFTLYKRLPHGSGGAG